MWRLCDCSRCSRRVEITFNPSPLIIFSYSHQFNDSINAFAFHLLLCQIVLWSVCCLQCTELLYSMKVSSVFCLLACLIYENTKHNCWLTLIFLAYITLRSKQLKCNLSFTLNWNLTSSCLLQVSTWAKKFHCVIWHEGTESIVTITLFL